jgi:nucleoside-diphosphate-sugar epimerase
LTGSELRIDREPFARGDVRVTSADLSRAGLLLGFTPLVPFEVGYECQVAWLRERMGQKVGVPV